MKLREALLQSGWESFQDDQFERWNTTDLLNTVLPGESPGWLDAECTVLEDKIIDSFNSELKEV